jgi:hypothetical protein
MLLVSATPKPKDHWASSPFEMLAFRPRGHVLNNYLFEVFCK